MGSESWKEISHLVPTKAFLQPSTDMSMLLHPVGTPTHLPFVLHFLLTQNVSPKDTARSDIMKLKSYKIT